MTDLASQTEIVKFGATMHVSSSRPLLFGQYLLDMGTSNWGGIPPEVLQPAQGLSPGRLGRAGHRGCAGHCGSDPGVGLSRRDRLEEQAGSKRARVKKRRNQPPGMDGTGCSLHRYHLPVKSIHCSKHTKAAAPRLFQLCLNRAWRVFRNKPSATKQEAPEKQASILVQLHPWA